MRKSLYFLLCIVFLTGNSFYLRAQFISTIAGTGVAGFSGNGGPATLAQFNDPTCIISDNSGNLYVCDQLNNWIRKIDASGIITTIAGKGGLGAYSGDGGLADTAGLNQCWGIALDAVGNLYIADQDNNCIRKVNTSGIISTIAGIGSAGYSGNGGPATLASLDHPLDIALDAAGNLYISDYSNYCIRKVDISGTITAFAGTTLPGNTGDGGPATQATLGLSYGIAVDNQGNVLIADWQYNCIRMVDQSGIIHTIAGNGIAGFGGDGGQATACQLNHPTNIYPDNQGNIFIADYDNNRIRKINQAGIISTFAGTGTNGFSGDGGLARSAELSYPLGLVIDNNGNTYIADLGNQRIRMVNNTKLLSFVGGINQPFSICENATSGSLNQVMKVEDLDTGLTLTWRVFSGPLHGHSFITYNSVSTGGVLTPSGLYYAPDSGYVGMDTMKVSVSNSILTDTTIILITIKPEDPSAGNIKGPVQVCLDASVVLTDSIRGGIWSTANNNISIYQMDSEAVITGINAGIDTIIYTFNNDCGTAVTTHTINVLPLPFAGTITGLPDVCAGSSIWLTDTVSGGLWNSQNNLVTLAPYDSIVIITGLASGPDVISYSVKGAFCTGVAIKTVTVNPLPYAGIIKGSNNVCVGSGIVLTDSILGGIWTASNGLAVFAYEFPGILITGISPGADYFTYEITNICGVDSTTDTIFIQPLPEEPMITKDGNILSVPWGYASYQWTLNGNPIPGANEDSFTETITGEYAVIVTNAPGCEIISQSIDCTGCSADDISVFPNPTTGLINIKWCKNVTIKLTCTDGRSFKPITNINGLDISLLPNGVYLLTIYDGTGNKLTTKCITKLSE